MEDKQPRIPKINNQPLSVGFIENRLPAIHEAFRDLPVHYDSELKQFLAASRQSSTMPSRHGQPGASHQISQVSDRTSFSAIKQSVDQFWQARGLPPKVHLMQFWNSILPEAQHQLKSIRPREPSKLLEPPNYSIRSKENWDGIYDQLQRAREVFDGAKSEFRGRFKKGYRTLADKGGAIQQALKVLPEHQVVSPIKAALEVIIDAVETASEARETITGAFNGDELEDAFTQVEFFLSTFPGDENIRKSSTALVADMLDSIERAIEYFLSSAGNRLIHSFQGKKSFQKDLLDSINRVRVGVGDLFKQAHMSHMAGFRAAMFYVAEQNDRSEQMLRDDISVVGEKVDDMANHMQALLDDGDKRREILCEEFDRIIIKQQRQIDGLCNCVRGLEQAYSRPTFVYAPPREVYYCRSPSEAVPQINPSFYVPTSTILDPTLHASEILTILGISDLDKEDIEAILEPGDSIPLRFRSNANQIITSDQFHLWATSAISCELLVQGYEVSNSVETESAMSLVSASLMRSLRNRDRFISLVFFCGRHVEYDDPFIGGGAIICSLTAQLLQQQFMKSSFSRQDTHPETLRDTDIGAVCALFERLVRSLPEHMTVVCVLDDVGCYENRQFEADMRRVLEFLLGLTRDMTLPAAIKVLATCPTGTVDVHKAFKQEDSSILSTEGLPQMAGELGMLEIEDEL